LFIIFRGVVCYSQAQLERILFSKSSSHFVVYFLILEIIQATTFWRILLEYNIQKVSWKVDQGTQLVPKPPKLFTLMNLVQYGKKLSIKNIVKMKSNLLGFCSTYGTYVLNSRQYLYYAKSLVFFPSKTTKVVSRDAPLFNELKYCSEFGYFYFLAYHIQLVNNHFFWWVHMD
jgi:hypothetical protein